MNKRMDNNPEMLKQMILHLKSELSQYKAKVSDYQENYHYQLLEELKKENALLLVQNAEYEKSALAFASEITEIKEVNQQLKNEVEKIKKESKVKIEEAQSETIKTEKKLEEMSNAYQKDTEEREKNLAAVQHQLTELERSSEQIKQQLTEQESLKEEILVLKQELDEKNVLLEQQLQQQIKEQEKTEDYKPSWFNDSINEQQEANKVENKRYTQVIKRVKPNVSPPPETPFLFGKGKKE